MSLASCSADEQRVMPHSFFILSRLFLRVDNVLFRVHDVRIYHAFGSGEIIREVAGMEASYNDVKAVSRASSPLMDWLWRCSLILAILVRTHVEN